MDFVVYHILNMFNGFQSYIISSYILILPILIIVYFGNVLTMKSFGEFLDFDAQYFSEFFGMVLCAPITFPIIVLFVFLLLFTSVLAWVTKVVIFIVIYIKEKFCSR